MRTESGILNIDDPTKVYGIALESSDEDTWRWRIYLPPGAKYTVHERSGHLPNAWLDRGMAAWFESHHYNSQATSSSGDAFTGELLVEVRFDQVEEKWFSRTTIRKKSDEESRVSGTKSRIYQPSGDWFSDRRGRIIFSSLNDRQQKEFGPNTPILLLHVQRPAIKELPNNGYSSTSPNGDADGVMIWLEPETTVGRAQTP